MRPQTVSDEEILTVARSVFFEQGAGASVETIAKELGLSQPALFKRFGTKRKLLIEAIRPPETLPWRDVVEALPDERSFQEQLAVVAGAMATFLKSITPIMRVILTTDIAPKEIFSKQTVPLPMQAVQLLTDWLERCYQRGLIRKANYRIAAMAMLGIFQLENFANIFKGVNLAQLEDHDAFVNEVIELVWQGLKDEK